MLTWLRNVFYNVVRVVFCEILALCILILLSAIMVIVYCVIAVGLIARPPRNGSAVNNAFTRIMSFFEKAMQDKA